MRILYVTPYPPSLVRVRPYQLIRGLIKRQHQVTLACPWSSEEERYELERLARTGVDVKGFHIPVWRPFWNCLCALPSRLPLQAAYSWHPGIARGSKDLLSTASFDAVHVEHLRGAQMGLTIRRRMTSLGLSAPIIWDSVDCITHLFEQAKLQSRSLRGRWMAALELSRTRRYEGWLAGQFDQVLVTSEKDRSALKALADQGDSGGEARAPITVLPNGVDLSYFRPSDVPRDTATLVFTGKMSYHANVTAVLHLVRNVMPRIWKRRPETRLFIVGKDPSLEVRALADPTGRTESSDSGGGVVVTGSVPDIRPYLSRATAAVVPLVYGAGIQNKVLEAFASATPVIATSRAVSALRVRPEVDFLLGEGPAEFAEKTLLLLERPEIQAKLARAGLAYVRAHHDWEHAAARLEEIYRMAAETKKRIKSAA